jgi:hypothetical protein
MPNRSNTRGGQSGLIWTAVVANLPHNTSAGFHPYWWAARPMGTARGAPQVRVAHASGQWTSDPIKGTFAGGPSYYSTNEQADVLIGIGWRIRRGDWLLGLE